MVLLILVLSQYFSYFFSFFFFRLCFTVMLILVVLVKLKYAVICNSRLRLSLSCCLVFSRYYCVQAYICVYCIFRYPFVPFITLVLSVLVLIISSFKIYDVFCFSFLIILLLSFCVDLVIPASQVPLSLQVSCLCAQ